jgi:hypothetical protein
MIHRQQSYDVAQPLHTPGLSALLRRAGAWVLRAAQIAGVTQPAYGAGGRVGDGLRSHVAPDSDSLSVIAAEFYDGDQSRYLDLYTIVFRSESEKPSNDKR